MNYLFSFVNSAERPRPFGTGAFGNVYIIMYSYFFFFGPGMAAR